MKKLLTSLAASLLLAAPIAKAQLKLYKDDVYGRINVVKNVKYGENAEGYATNDPTSLFMDIYTPVSDTRTNRPVLILAPGASFVTQAFVPVRPLGTKEDNWLVETAIKYARKGYVVAAINYRVGWNPLASSEDVRKEGIIQAAWRAIQDGRAAVRYFRKNAAEYGIDPNKIAMGGSEGGAYLPIHINFFDRPSELILPKVLKPDGNPIVDTTRLGGFEGNSGNPGFDSRPNLGIAIAGAILDTTLINGGERPMLAIHGTANPNTPYGTENVIVTATNQAVIEVSGAREFMRIAAEKGNQTVLEGFTGGDSNTDVAFGPLGSAPLDPSKRITVPGLYSYLGKGSNFYTWLSAERPGFPNEAGAKAILDTMYNFLTPRMFKVLGLPDVDVASAEPFEPVTSIAERYVNSLDAPINIFPNPVSGNQASFQINNSLVGIEAIEVVDITGRIAQTITGNGTYFMENVSLNLPAGLYTARLLTTHGIGTQKLVIR